MPPDRIVGAIEAGIRPSSGSVRMVTDPGPTLEELLVGVEGLALLRTLYTGTGEDRTARLASGPFGT